MGPCLAGLGGHFGEIGVSSQNSKYVFIVLGLKGLCPYMTLNLLKPCSEVVLKALKLLGFWQTPGNRVHAN